MSDTPKTDAEYLQWGSVDDARDFCRDLERENAKLRSNFMAAESEIILFREERDGLRAENAALRETLHDIMTESDEQVIWRMARAALEKEAQL